MIHHMKNVISEMSFHYDYETELTVRFSRNLLK